LLDLNHEAFNYFEKFWMLFLNYYLISLEMLFNMLKELLEMLLIIQNQFIYDGFMQFNTWKLI